MYAKKLKSNTLKIFIKLKEEKYMTTYIVLNLEIKIFS